MSFHAAVMAVPALPLIAAGVAAASGGCHARWTARLGAGAAGLGLLIVAALAIRVGIGSPVEISWRDSAGDVLAGVSVDRLAVSLLLLIYGISTVVQCFAVRYLHGDDRLAWFSASAGLLTAANAGIVTSSTLIGLALCWTLAGVALCLMLGTYPKLAAARQGVARTAAALAIGDLALWAAVAMITWRVGTVEVSRLGSAIAGQPKGLIGAVSLLIVLAALARSAQIPFHRWLPATLGAPTPASALLHAGVVNGGGVLLVRTGALVGHSTTAMSVAAVAGALTLLYGSAAMLTKTDAKGVLVHSTSAQMGFMIFTSGLGFYGAAVFHLIAHGLYKATLFLGSGSALARRERAARRAPASQVPRRWPLQSAVGAVGLAALAATVAGVVMPSVLHTDGVVLLLFGWVTGAAIIAGWSRRQRTAWAMMVAVITVAIVAVCYLVAVGGFTAYIADTLPPTAPLPTVWPVAAVLAALAILLTIRQMPTEGRGGLLHRRVYATALNAGYVGAGKGVR